MWEEFIQWLRTKNITLEKDFKNDCEWKCLINKKSERLCIKGNSDGCKAHKKQSKITVKVVMSMIKNVMK